MKTIIFLVVLFVSISFSQTVKKVNKVEKVRTENVLNKTANRYIVRKIGNNYVVDLIREYIDKDGNKAVEVLATDRTYDGIKYILTKIEKDKLDGKVK